MRDTVTRLVRRSVSVVELHVRELGSDLIDVARGEYRGLNRRAYEAGDRGRRLGDMRAPGTDGNAELAADGDTMRRRSRTIERDSSYGLKAMREFATDQVGTGIRPQFQADDDKTEKRLQADWEEWSYQADGLTGGTIYGMQFQEVLALARDGGVLCRRMWRRPGEKDTQGQPLIVPLQLQPMEVDYLTTEDDGRTKDGTIISNGIELDAQGRRVAYHLYRNHPGAQWMWGMSGGYSLDRQKVSASEVLHAYAYSTSRPGQVVGAPWLHAVIARLWDHDGWIDGTMLARRMSASVAAFVEGGDPYAAPDSVDGIAPAGTGTKAHVLDGHGYPVEMFEPGIVAYLPNGKQVQFPEQPDVPGHEETVRVTLREIAAGTGMSYEGLSGDVSKGSFIALRLGLLGRRRLMDAFRAHVTIPLLCRPKGLWFLQAEELAGRWNREENPVRVTWVPPAVEDADELTRMKTLEKKIRMGVLSQFRALMGEGEVPENVIEEIRRWNALLDAEPPIVLDTDPRHRTQAGVIQFGKLDPDQEDDSDKSAKSTGQD